MYADESYLDAVQANDLNESASKVALTKSDLKFVEYSYGDDSSSTDIQFKPQVDNLFEHFDSKQVHTNPIKFLKRVDVAISATKQTVGKDTAKIRMTEKVNINKRTSARLSAATKQSTNAATKSRQTMQVVILDTLVIEE